MPEQSPKALERTQIRVEESRASGETEAELGQAPRFQWSYSRQFTAWLAEQRLGLAFTTYQTHRLFFVGHSPDGQVWVCGRLFGRAMGLYADPERLWLSTLFQLWRFDNILKPGQLRDGCDQFYLPVAAYTTGDLDIHDLAVDRRGRLIFVNTLYSCLATLADGYSFEPVWWPPFISKLAAEDRCHLNGLAMRDGEPAYVTALSRTDITDGWRGWRGNGGIVVDIANNSIILEGLSMPHSPRWHNNRLWLLESGTGHFGYADLERGQFEPLTFCPGYMRGLAFHKRFAIVGVSKPRHNRTFQGLSLDDNLIARNAEARCGLMVIDTESGDIVHWLELEDPIVELYDVAVLQGVVRPTAMGVADDEIRRIIRMKSSTERVDID